MTTLHLSCVFIIFYARVTENPVKIRPVYRYNNWICHLYCYFKQAKPQQNISSSIETNEWYDYFRSLLYSDQAPSIVINNNTDTINDDVISLNEPFTLAEVEFKIRKLLNNKSSGIDGIPAEFYKNSLKNITLFFVLLFNQFFYSGYFPKTWGQSILCPIHESGPTHITGNYRGNSLTNIMNKIFCG